MLMMTAGSEAGLQDQPQAGETRAGAAGLGHGAGHEGRPGLVPKQVKRRKVYASV